MVPRYLIGSRPVLATGLLQEASGRVLRMRDALDVQDFLCLQLVLGNVKRGGDITHIRAEGSRSRKDTGNIHIASTNQS